jgi:hypothetical protein
MINIDPNKHCVRICLQQTKRHSKNSKAFVAALSNEEAAATNIHARTTLVSFPAHFQRQTVEEASNAGQANSRPPVIANNYWPCQANRLHKEQSVKRTANNRSNQLSSARQTICKVHSEQSLNKNNVNTANKRSSPQRTIDSEQSVQHTGNNGSNTPRPIVQAHSEQTLSSAQRTVCQTHSLPSAQRTIGQVKQTTGQVHSERSVKRTANTLSSAQRTTRQTHSEQLCQAHREQLVKHTTSSLSSKQLAKCTANYLNEQMDTQRPIGQTHSEQSNNRHKGTESQH